MNFVSMSTDALAPRDRGASWREFICQMIHNVAVDKLSTDDFAARISARRHGSVSCASFWSKAHQVRAGRETIGSAGASGYLVSWQIEGDAHITHDDEQILLRPGGLAIIDGRRPMEVTFPGEVRRIVANLPAHAMESRLPELLRSHAMVMRPAGPFAGVLYAYLDQLSAAPCDIAGRDVELLVDNICNLLVITSGRGDAPSVSQRDLRRQALLRHVRDHARDPALTIDRVAADMGMSRRLLQKLLHEAGDSFTEVLLAERLELAVRQIGRSIPKAGGESISAIAYRCGFSDVSHFNHAFRRRFGASPSEMRGSRAHREPAPGTITARPAGR